MVAKNPNIQVTVLKNIIPKRKQIAYAIRAVRNSWIAKIVPGVDKFAKVNISTAGATKAKATTEF